MVGWRTYSFVLGALFVLGLILLALYLFYPVEPQQVIIRKAVIDQEQVLRSEAAAQERLSREPKPINTVINKRPQETVSLGALEKDINKSLSAKEIEGYFKPETVNKNKQEFKSEIVYFQKAYARPELPITPAKNVAGQPVTETSASSSVRQQYEVFYEYSQKGGSRVIEEKQVQKQAWEEKAQDNVLRQHSRTVMVELPRKFERFSLGDSYKGSGVLQDSFLENSLINLVEGRLYRGQMYYFVINFRPAIDVYYLAAVLQDLFAVEADLRKVGNYLVFNWDDGKTKIEYIIYDAHTCRLHFYDVALGRQKIKNI